MSELMLVGLLFLAVFIVGASAWATDPEEVDQEELKEVRHEEEEGRG